MGSIDFGVRDDILRSDTRQGFLWFHLSCIDVRRETDFLDPNDEAYVHHPASTRTWNHIAYAVIALALPLVYTLLRQCIFWPQWLLG